MLLARRHASLLVCVVLCADAVGCVEESNLTTVEIHRPECENLNQAHCILPWPSSRFLRDDPSTPTGRVIALPPDVLPPNELGSPLDPAIIDGFDGFSPTTSILTVLKERIETSQLVGPDRIEESVAPGASTILVDAETGERVAHFAEMDRGADVDPSRVVLFIRPAKRLAEGRRYVVGVRTLVGTDGAPLEPTPYFRALRDGIPTSEDEIEARREHFDGIFAALERAGAARGELLEAWDFETASGEAAWQDLAAMAADALERTEDAALGCTVETVEEDFGSEVLWRRVRGTFTVPVYLEDLARGSRLSRDAEGRPISLRTAEARFEVLVPYTLRDQVLAGGGPGPLLTVGHGLFESAEDASIAFDHPGYVPSRSGMIVVATDWWGMSRDDLAYAGEVASDFGLLPGLIDRMAQGVINTLLLTRLFSGPCATLPELSLADGASSLPLLDASRRYYMGFSLGAILGLTYVALSPDVDRSVLVVGGMSFPLIMGRSSRFPPLEDIFSRVYPERVDRQTIMALSASQWDKVEGAGFGRHVVAGSLRGGKPARVLYQIAVHDAQVPNVSSHMAARTIGLPVLSPSPAPVWGVPAEPAPQDSAYVLFDLGAEPTRHGPVPAYENGVHYDVHLLEPQQRQVAAFLQPDGVVEHFCDGPCDPE